MTKWKGLTTKILRQIKKFDEHAMRAQKIELDFSKK